MSNLTDFLLREVAADEEAARAAWPASWESKDNSVQSTDTGLRAGYEGLHTGVAHLHMTVGKYQTEARNATHIARWDPDRVLAECEAKRRIVAEAKRYGEPRKIRPEYRGDLFVPEIGDESLIRQYHRISDAEDDEWPWDLGRIWKREDYEAQVREPRREFIFLRLLALPYSDREGYREEWRPE